MVFRVEILNQHNVFFGFGYRDGTGNVKDKDVIFHEFGIGLIVFNLYFMFWEKGV